MATLSEKITHLCNVLDNARTTGKTFDNVFSVSLQGMLEDCAQEARNLEQSLVPPVQVGPVDCRHYAAIARLHLTQQRTIDAAEVSGLAAVAILHEATTCVPTRKREARTS